MKPKLLFLCASLLLTVSVGAQEPKPQTNIDPQAQAVVDQMMAAYKNLSALHEKITFHFETTPASPNSPRDAQSELRWQKPNKLWYREEDSVSPGKTRKTVIVCDGKTLWRWESGTNTYSKKPVPTSFTFLNSLPHSTPEFEILFAGKSPFADPDMPPTSITLGKQDKIGDLDVDVLDGKIQDPNVPGTMRFLIGSKDHLIRAMVVEAGGKNPATGQSASLTATAAYPLVDTTPTFTAADFTFTLPPGAKPATTPGGSKKPKTP